MGVKMLSASDNRFEEFSRTRKCRQIYNKESAGRAESEDCRERRGEGNRMMESTRDNIIENQLKTGLLFSQSKCNTQKHLSNIYSLDNIRHWGIWQMFPFCVWECPECLSKWQNQNDIANKWRVKHTVSQNFPFLTSVGLNRCSAQLPTQAPLWVGRAHQ